MEKSKSAILSRMFAFQEKYNPEVKGHSMQVYTKYYYQTYKRNVGLWLIPSMYTIAKGERKFISEQYDKYTITGNNEYETRRQVYYTTIPHNRSTMSVLDNFSLPNLYSPTLYGKHILSPICKENRFFYKYKVTMRGSGQARIDFRPRAGNNIQLVSGTAIVVTATGRILDIVIKGEHDMVNFSTTFRQGSNGKSESIPTKPMYCKTDIDFKFLGNHIASSFTSVFNCPTLLPDTVDVTGDRAMIEKLRPIKLSKEEKAIYAQYDSLQTARNDTTRQDSTSKTSMLQSLKEFGDGVGSQLLSSHSATNERYHIKLSPIIEPQYISYSHSRGLSYKMKFTAEYYFNNNAGLYFTPTLGYNFKIKKFYSYMPLRYIYNKEKNNYLELSMDIGNRTGNSSVLDELKDEMGELPELEEIHLDDFDDYNYKLFNNTQLTHWLRMELGLVYHRRVAVEREMMRFYNKPDVYRSLAPSVGVHIMPWKNGPMLSVNYERTLHPKNFDINYERWESSASIIIHLPSTKLLNLQVGGGLYTKRASNYFMDFSNFCVDNLPGGWDDDWSGDFQLLDSRIYNMSHYYVSSNISYDSPLLMTSFIPIVGKYVERERFYWSGLLIEYNRPYHEMGYGFTTPFFSFGLFAAFHNLDFLRFGTKFTFELFHRW
jgi:hypothetical protein